MSHLQGIDTISLVPTWHTGIQLIKCVISTLKYKEQLPTIVISYNMAEMLLLLVDSISKSSVAYCVLLK